MVGKAIDMAAKSCADVHGSNLFMSRHEANECGGGHKGSIVEHLSGSTPKKSQHGHLEAKCAQ
jgi:hypothetical protein